MRTYHLLSLDVFLEPKWHRLPRPNSFERIMGAHVRTYVRTYFRHRGLGGLGLGLGNTGGLRVTCTYQRETTTYVAALPTESTDVRRQHPREESGFYILSGLWLDTYVRIWNLAGRLSEVRIAQ